MNAFQVSCEKCGKPTSQAYARLHDRQCKACYTGKTPLRRDRNERTTCHAEQLGSFLATEYGLDSSPY